MTPEADPSIWLGWWIIGGTVVYLLGIFATSVVIGLVDADQPPEELAPFVYGLWPATLVIFLLIGMTVWGETLGKRLRGKQ